MDGQIQTKWKAQLYTRDSKAENLMYNNCYNGYLKKSWLKPLCTMVDKEWHIPNHVKEKNLSPMQNFRACQSLPILEPVFAFFVINIENIKKIMPYS